MTLPPLHALAKYAHETPEGLRFEVPTRAYLVQAAGVGVLLPVVWCLLAVVMILGTDPSDPVALGLFGGGAVLASGVSLALGVGLALAAGGRARRSGVTIDGVGLHGAGRDVPLDAVVGVSVGPPNPLLKWLALSAMLDDGTKLHLIAQIPPRAGADAHALADALGRRFGVPVQTPPGLANMGVLGLDDRRAAAACWLPVQGVFLVASVWYLFRGRERPFVLFAAKQSLAWFAMFFGLLVFVVGVGAAGVYVSEEAGVAPVGVALLVLLLVPLVGINLVARIYATVQCYRGKAVLLPWLRPLFASSRPDDLPR